MLSTSQTVLEPRHFESLTMSTKVESKTSERWSQVVGKSRYSRRGSHLTIVTWHTVCGHGVDTATCADLTGHKMLKLRFGRIEASTKNPVGQAMVGGYTSVPIAAESPIFTPWNCHQPRRRDTRGIDKDPAEAIGRMPPIDRRRRIEFGKEPRRRHEDAE